MGNIVPFRTPDAPIEGAERKAAIKSYWKAAEVVAERTICEAFSKAFRMPGCNRIDLNDAVPLFVAAFRRELDKSGY